MDVMVPWPQESDLVAFKLYQYPPPTPTPPHPDISSIRRPGAANRSVTRDYCPVRLFGLRL